MSKYEKVIQWIKIILFLLAGSYIVLKIEIIIDLLNGN